MPNFQFDHQPVPAPRRIAMKVKPAAEYNIRLGHPWVFEGSIIKVSAMDEARAGDLAVIFDRKNNKFLALGLFDPSSAFRVKIIHTGKQRTVDEAFFQDKIAAAFAKRKPLLEGGKTNSYRLLHGENDGLPGIVADVYAGVLVVKLYSAIWRPYLPMLLPLLFAQAQTQTLVLRLSRTMMHGDLAGFPDGQVCFGELPQEEVIFLEHGLRFSANVVRGHKTGFFLDHRHNRKRVGVLAAGRTVLDVFAYAGGFSVHALAGGATEVTSLDISGQALAAAERNVALNFTGKNHQTVVGDAFEVMEDLFAAGKKYGLVVVDPPAFAKRESEVEQALNSYGRLARLAVRLVGPGGILMLASCSSRVSEAAFFDVVQRALAASGRQVVLWEKTFHDVDHPIGFVEGAYLKSGFWRVG